MATSEGDLTNPNLDDLPERVQQTLIDPFKEPLWIPCLGPDML